MSPIDRALDSPFGRWVLQVLYTLIVSACAAFAAIVLLGMMGL